MILEDTLKIKKFFEQTASVGVIDDERIILLKSIALKIHEVNQQTKDATYLNFICTHNSRRSQLAQVWAYFAASYFDLPTIKAYSGGTAVTAFFKNTVKTLQAAGFHFNVEKFNHQNPTYAITFDDKHKALLGFSKLYDDKSNVNPFIAITTCSSADENCPFIPNAIFRFHLPYKDPKESDNTRFEAEAYLKTNSQIAAEIYFLFQEIQKLHLN
mgnify:CR=1 FL=1